MPSGNTSVKLTRSFLIVTIRSIKVRDVNVVLVAFCTMFYILNMSKIERSFSLFLLNEDGRPFKSSPMEKSQLKSPNKTMFDDFNQAFSSGHLRRLKNSLSSGGLYITENKTEVLGNLTCSQIASRPLINKSFPCVACRCSV